MINLDDERAEVYLAESREHLADVETDLLALEKGAGEADGELIDRVFRAVHSVEEKSAFFELMKVRELAHETENVLELIRCRQMVPTAERVRILLSATDTLRELVRNPATSNQADITAIKGDLGALLEHHRASAAHGPVPAGSQLPQGGGQLRVLLVEDDFASRLLLQVFLSRYGECHVAVNGREAVNAYAAGLERGQPYDLICMDIMMPEMDGREAVRQIRAMEATQGILSTFGVKIIMTTTVGDLKEVSRCFQELCDAYLMKPIDLGKLLEHMKSYRLI
jgi:two-component system, chemotaxis family, chemotaxis protein CheY